MARLMDDVRNEKFQTNGYHRIENALKGILLLWMSPDD